MAAKYLPILSRLLASLYLVCAQNNDMTRETFAPNLKERAATARDGVGKGWSHRLESDKLPRDSFRCSVKCGMEVVRNKYSPSDFEASGNQSAVSVSAKDVFVQKTT